uniref:HTH OST-type domain-containing protein n=1 Tax=Anopheles culicifacies TaxID=139723 RepID=A0A182MA40_9DIPT
MDELKAMIRSLAISSASGMSLAELDHDFKSLEGHSIPYKDHGFKSLYAMLQTLSDVVRVSGNDQRSTIYPVTTEKNEHIRLMVEKSKKSKKRKPSSYRLPASSSQRQKPPKFSANPIQCYITTNETRNVGRKSAHKRPSQNSFSEADYHFDQFWQNLNGMLGGGTAQNGPYNWNGNVNRGASQKHQGPNRSYHNNQQNFYQKYNNQQYSNQQYYQHYVQQIAQWNYNYAGWNYCQAIPQQSNSNYYYPANNAYCGEFGNRNNSSNWNSSWNNNMYCNNYMGYNNAGGYANQWNYGMGNFMGYGYNNNYPPNAFNNGANNYNMSNWYSGYGPYQYYSQ